MIKCELGLLMLVQQLLGGQNLRVLTVMLKDKNWYVRENCIGVSAEKKMERVLAFPINILW